MIAHPREQARDREPCLPEWGCHSTEAPPRRHPGDHTKMTKISFGVRVGDFDVAGLAAAVRRAVEAHEPGPHDLPRRISCLGIYGNPLTSPETVADWERLVDAAAAFG